MAVYTPERLYLASMTLIFLLIVTSVQGSSLFQCQSSSDQSGLVYTPNIPDLYFNDENAANLLRKTNLTVTEKKLTYIFTIPSGSHDCSGTVRSIQYCYRAWHNSNTSSEQQQKIHFLILSQDGQSFSVEETITIKTTPRENICTPLWPNKIDNKAYVCCDSASLPLTASNFQITSASDFIFGVTVLSSQLKPLIFASSATQYNVEHYQVRLNGSDVAVTNEDKVSSGFFLLQFIIETDPTLTVTQTSTKSESDKALSGVIGVSLSLITILLCIITVLLIRREARESNFKKGLRAFVKKGNGGPTNEELLEDVEMQEK